LGARSKPPVATPAVERVVRATERPPFDLDEYVRDSEARLHIAPAKVPANSPSTQPPPPEHASLLDSCKQLPVAPSDGDETDGSSSTLDPRRITPNLDAVAVLLLTADDLEWLDLDAEARALIALVDDQRIVEEILTQTKTDVVRGIAIFERLAAEGVVAFV
jgi:hypothetical protein